MRLATTVYFAPFMPIALFIYGWTARSSVHWIVPCLSFIPFGFGLLGIFVPCQTYMVDAFLETAASAVAAMGWEDVEESGDGAAAVFAAGVAATGA